MAAVELALLPEVLCSYNLGSELGVNRSGSSCQPELRSGPIGDILNYT